MGGAQLKLTAASEGRDRSTSPLGTAAGYSRAGEVQLLEGMVTS